MEERHGSIKKRNLEDKIKELFYEKKYPYQKIADELNLSYSAVYRFIRDDKLKNYNDRRLDAVARSDTYNALSLIDSLFDSASAVAKELQFAMILASKMREKVASIVDSDDIEGLHLESNAQVYETYMKNTDKIIKLAQITPKHLDTYINLYSEILDIQREVSYVRVVTEILRKQDPETYKLIQEALNRDNAAKAVMDSLSTQDIVDYWSSNKNIPGKAKLTLEEGKDNGTH